MITVQIHARNHRNATAAIRYNFDAPINQAKEKDDKDLELSEKITREIK